MRYIYKHRVPLNDAWVEIELHRTAQIVFVGAQEHDAIVFWTEEETSRPKYARRFRVFGTGHPIEDADAVYRGTVQAGIYVWHLFEQLSAIKGVAP